MTEPITDEELEAAAATLSRYFRYTYYLGELPSEAHREDARVLLATRFGPTLIARIDTTESQLREAKGEVEGLRAERDNARNDAHDWHQKFARVAAQCDQALDDGNLAMGAGAIMTQRAVKAEAALKAIEAKGFFRDADDYSDAECRVQLNRAYEIAAAALASPGEGEQ